MTRLAMLFALAALVLGLAVGHAAGPASAQAGLLLPGSDSGSAAPSGVKIIIIDESGKVVVSDDGTVTLPGADEAKKNARSADEMGSMLMDAQKEANRFRAHFRERVAQLPAAYNEVLYVLRASSPDGTLWSFFEVFYLSALLLFVGYLFETRIFGRRIARGFVVSRILENPQGYREKLPFLVFRFAAGVLGALISMAVAYVIGLTIYGKAEDSALQFTVTIIFSSYLLFRVVALVWRMVLSPFLPQYRIPAFSDHDAKRLFYWLWVGAFIGIFSEMLAVWVRELGLNEDIYSLMLFGSTVILAILNMALVLVNRRAISNAIRGGNPPEEVSANLRWASYLWAPVALIYILFSIVQLIGHSVRGEEISIPLISGAYAAMMTAFVVYGIFSYLIERWSVRAHEMRRVNAASRAAETAETVAGDMRDRGPDESGPDESGPDESGPEESGPGEGGPREGGPGAGGPGEGGPGERGPGDAGAGTPARAGGNGPTPPPAPASPSTQTAAQMAAVTASDVAQTGGPVEEATSPGGDGTSAAAVTTAQRPPGRSLKSYEDLAHRVAGILALIAGIWANLIIWGVTPDFARFPFLDRLVDVATITFIGYVVYQAFRIWIDGKIAEELPDNDGAELGDEGGGGGSRLGTLLPLFRNVILIVIFVTILLITLLELGINVSPLFAGAGIVGIAIGFGAQSLVRDIFSGAFFLIDDAFRKGEYIDVGDVKGTVEKISVRSFQLRHHLGALHTIPFGEIRWLTNYSRDWVIMKLKLRLTYDTDVERVRKLIKKLGQELLEDPVIGHSFLQPLKSQGVIEMQDSAMIVRVKFMTKPGDQWLVRKQVYQSIRELFAREGIKFANREVTVHIADDRAEPKPLTEEQKKAIAGAALDMDEMEGFEDLNPGGDDR